MTVAPSLAAGRRAAESRMTDTVTVRLPSTETTYDPDEFTDVPVPGEIVYDGPGRIVELATQDGTPNVAGASWAVFQFGVHLPVVGSERVATGCEATVASAQFDAALVDRKYRVLVPPASSQVTARRITLEWIGR